MLSHLKTSNIEAWKFWHTRIRHYDNMTDISFEEWALYEQQSWFFLAPHTLGSPNTEVQWSDGGHTSGPPTHTSLHAQRKANHLRKLQTLWTEKSDQPPLLGKRVEVLSYQKQGGQNLIAKKFSKVRQK